MSLSKKQSALQRAAHELMYLSMDSSPVYNDEICHGGTVRLTVLPWLCTGRV